jgi:hypothetical protein
MTKSSLKERLARAVQIRGIGRIASGVLRPAGDRRRIKAVAAILAMRITDCADGHADRCQLARQLGSALHRGHMHDAYAAFHHGLRRRLLRPLLGQPIRSSASIRLALR